MNFDPTGEVDLIEGFDNLDDFDGFDLLVLLHEEAKKRLKKILDEEEVIDLVFRSAVPGNVRAGLLFPFGNTVVRLDGSSTIGAPIFSEGLTHFSPMFSFDDLLARSARLVTELGGESLVRSVVQSRRGAFEHVTLAVTRTAGSITEITLVVEQPVTGAAWWKEVLSEPLDVVWNDRFDQTPKEAIAALGRVISRNDGDDLVYGSVLAELTGSPVEWVRSFLDGSSES